MKYSDLSKVHELLKKELVKKEFDSLKTSQQGTVDLNSLKSPVCKIAKEIAFACKKL